MESDPSCDDTGGENGREPGRPFGDDYPDRRSDEERKADGRTLTTQIGGLGGRLSDPESEDRLLGRLAERRNPDQNWGEHPAPVQFRVVRSLRGTRILLVPDEVLVARRALDDPDLDVRARLESEGFVEEDDPAGCTELTERVARFVGGRLSPEQLVRFVSELRASGVPASANHVTPLAAVVKGEGGPALTVARRDFPGVAVRAKDEGPRVAVIDTGVAAELRGDGWLAPQAFPRAADGSNIDVIDAFPPPGNGLLDAASGHGTFVCGVVQQVCPTARVQVYRGPDSDGIASEMQVACAMVRAVQDGADILNLSLGSQTVDDGPPVALAAALDLIAEVEERESREVLLVAAAGNDGDEARFWPAAFERVVAVAGLDAASGPAKWSSRGDWVTCSTIGEGVYSTFLPGTEDGDIDLHSPDRFGTNSWALWVGTSFCAPQVVGAVARTCQETGVTPREALAALLAAGTPEPLFGQRLRILPGTLPS